jgi:hypothetical protein
MGPASDHNSDLAFMLCCDRAGKTIGSPLAMTALGGFKNRSGRSGTSLPNSRACAA